MQQFLILFNRDSVPCPKPPLTVAARKLCRAYALPGAGITTEVMPVSIPVRTLHVAAVTELTWTDEWPDLLAVALGAACGLPAFQGVDADFLLSAAVATT